MLKKIVTIGLFTLFMALSLSQASFAYAIPPEYAPDNTPFAPNKDGETGGIDFAEKNGEPSIYAIVILQIIAGGLLYVAAPFTVVVIALAAFNLVMGGDNPEKVGTAKKQIIWALMGLILIILSYSLAKIVIDIALNAGTPSEPTTPPTEPATFQFEQTEAPLSLQHYLS